MIWIKTILALIESGVLISDEVKKMYHSINKTIVFTHQSTITFLTPVFL